MALFRRRKIEENPITPIVDETPVAQQTKGPWDASERDTSNGYVDYGSLRVPTKARVVLQPLQLPGHSAVQSLRAVAGTSAVIFTVIADRKSGGIRQEIIEMSETQFAEQGVKYDWAEGPWGSELIIYPEDKGVTPTRLAFVEGPRWVLRIQIIGQATIDDSAREIINSVVDDVVVFRDDSPRPAGNIIPLVIPDATAQLEEIPDGGN
ncbi:MAG: DUF3710 domain-containing protein [Actinomycetaceae bacterium]|nr:DUF3710 domain-containing protein [Actinomycetaceae bacterium]